MDETSCGIKGFSVRLRESLGGKSIRGFARECGLSEGVLRSYLRGDTYPTLDRMDAIAAAAGVDRGWLTTGEESLRLDGASQAREAGSGYRSIDERRVGEAIERVETFLQGNGVELAPAKKKELILTVYDFLSRGEKIDLGTLARLVKLAC